MISPTITQQRAIAYAPIPFAVISFISSSYVTYYLLCKERKKLERLYHRLILGMNFVLLLMSFIWITAPFAVPAGTPNYAGASGTIQTCTASAFIYLTTILGVPTYYGSLSLQALMGIKNNFMEEKYRWIEKYIHLVAWTIPCAISIFFAATENFNPNGSGCWIAKAPLGCETDPDNVPCERGGNTNSFDFYFQLSLLFPYFIFPTSFTMSLYCWIGKAVKERETLRGRSAKGMQQIREIARKEMMHRIRLQICLYLASLLFTAVPGITVFVYQLLTGEILYGAFIFGNCIIASQGFIYTAVYFTLQRLGKPNLEGQGGLFPRLTIHTFIGDTLTVGDIRSSVQRKEELGPELVSEERDSFVFNIFDGTPDEDSPWARFIDQDDDISDHSDRIEESTGESNIAETQEK